MVAMKQIAMGITAKNEKMCKKGLAFRFQRNNADTTLVAAKNGHKKALARNNEDNRKMKEATIAKAVQAAGEKVTKAVGGSTNAVRGSTEKDIRRPSSYSERSCGAQRQHLPRHSGRESPSSWHSSRPSKQKAAVYKREHGIKKKAAAARKKAA